MWLKAPGRTLEALAAKGSVSVDGVSLTGRGAAARPLRRSRLIPLTLEGTTLGAL